MASKSACVARYPLWTALVEFGIKRQAGKEQSRILSTEKWRKSRPESSLQTKA